MTTNGIEAVYLETHNWGKAAAFWQQLGFSRGELAAADECRGAAAAVDPHLRPGEKVRPIDRQGERAGFGHGILASVRVSLIIIRNGSTALKRGPSSSDATQPPTSLARASESG